MGKGDKKTKKGKIWKGSFGNSRPKAKGSSYSATATSEKVVAEAVEVKAKPKKKVAPKKKAADKE